MLDNLLGFGVRYDVTPALWFSFSDNNAISRRVVSSLFPPLHVFFSFFSRPGFDEFLLRLRACGLRYRLKRISAVLPAPLLDALSRRTSAVPVVGGPISGGTASNITATAPTDAGDFEVPAIAGGHAGGFEEFVLCSIRR